MLQCGPRRPATYGGSILRIVWTKEKHNFLKLLETARGCVRWVGHGQNPPEPRLFDQNPPLATLAAPQSSHAQRRRSSKKAAEELQKRDSIIDFGTETIVLLGPQGRGTASTSPPRRLEHPYLSVLLQTEPLARKIRTGPTLVPFRLIVPVPRWSHSDSSGCPSTCQK